MANDLERSHDELRGALIFAERYIKKLSPRGAGDPAVKILQRSLREARAVRKTRTVRLVIPLPQC